MSDGDAGRVFISEWPDYLWTRPVLPIPARPIVLHPGWNLVSWSGPATAAVLKPVQTLLDVAYRWNRTTGTLEAILVGTGDATTATVLPNDDLWLLVGGNTSFLWDQPGA